MYLPMKGRIYPEGYPDHFCLGASLFPVIVVASKGPAGQFAKTLRNKGQPRKELPSKAFKDSTQLEETISSELQFYLSFLSSVTEAGNDDSRLFILGTALMQLLILNCYRKQIILSFSQSQRRATCLNCHISTVFSSLCQN